MRNGGARTARKCKIFNNNNNNNNNNENNYTK